MDEDQLLQLLEDLKWMDDLEPEQKSRLSDTLEFMEKIRNVLEAKRLVEKDRIKSRFEILDL